ncbi:NTP pyrophosphatase, house-cleaning of non-canonical NTPs [Luteibacter sp. UNC138MFCol5.1]|uniref:nucleotide pyrophosphohydrolase n=1 Tax=Luteibacter sp. UNC138MFCol5.1 TaxID=1502774 RepID=UPI0008BE523C|nr:nucleotide pyrophosphohydrolase [Luteibacter sp. UNC138MFCol5.1]SEP09065.1 NTP pyrophosphatase, house-cleaning of non-canonical NTPs [Luteibacter sp. UNC138MFCol5.1]
MDTKCLQAMLQEFADVRDWDKFHNPKNLAIALAVEVGEVLELFQWLSEADAADVRINEQLKARVSEELADVAIYLLRLADKSGVDLDAAIAEKILSNGKKYPVDRVFGSAKKYTEY